VDVLTAMKVFVKVAEINSYAHAAESLEMSVPRISRIISDLEQDWRWSESAIG
jgi:DNA-binding transcriptional LysR family regulator